MPMRILYEAGVQATSEDITNRVRLYTLDVAQNSEEGSVAISSVTIDDPDGNYDVVGWRRVRIYEDMATGSNTLMYNGWVADRNISRGPFVVTDARIWECSLSDMNAIISMRVLNGTNANRGAETDVQRINWLMGTAEMNRIVETEYISSASPKNMDAVDYRGQTLIDVINDCAQQSGKNFFVYSKDNGVGNSITLGLFYDFSASTAYSSPLRLSNVLTDVDNNFTFAIAEDTTLVRDPSRTYSGAYVRYDGGAVYEENITTSNLFTRRDAVYDASNVKNSTTATNRALRYLNDTNVEEDRVKTAFWVPAGKVNFVKPGMRIQIKAQHLPGYENFVWGRVVKHQIKQISEIDESTGVAYLMSLELVSKPNLSASCVGGLYMVTPSQHFLPLGSTTSDSVGLVIYDVAGVPVGQPKPNNVGVWGFPEYHGPSGADYAGDCTLSALYFVVVGAGTLTVQTSIYGGSSPAGMSWQVYHYDSVGAASIDQSLGMFATGSQISINVPNDGSKNCVHVIRFTDGQGACGSKWGWTGADWDSA